MAPLIVSQANVDNVPALGGLFNGLSFFLIQRVPSRSTFISRIQANGGRVVKLEASADYVIADHVRSDAPPGSISYTFIEQAIKTGGLPDPHAHLAGPRVGTIREVGSVQPGKSTRRAFTAEEDRILWQWVEKSRANGAAIKGNAIYKELEARDPRHTHQAWRDRYLKKLMDNPPAGVEVQVAANAPPTPPAAPDQEEQEYVISDGQSEIRFSHDNYEELLGNAEDIEKVDETQVDEAWKAWATAKPYHTAGEWQQFYERVVRPIYRAQAKERKNVRAADARNTSVAAPASKVSERQTTPVVSGGTNPETEAANASSGEGMSKTAQKRKNETSTAESEAAQSHKKQRIESSEQRTDKQRNEIGAAASLSQEQQASNQAGQLSDRSHPGNVQPETTVDLLELSDTNLTSQVQQNKDDTVDSGGTADKDQIHDPQIMTSDLNRAADQQIRGESLEGADNSRGASSPHPHSELPTSDANDGADQQLRRESFDNGDHVARDSEQGPAEEVPSPDANGAADHQARHELPGSLGEYANEIMNIDKQGIMNGDSVRPSESRGPTITKSKEIGGEEGNDTSGEDVSVSQAGSTALTEANLASQQASHEPLLMRGIDLPEDDRMQDQSAFLSFLQKVTGQRDNPEAQNQGHTNRWKASKENKVTLSPGIAPQNSNDNPMDAEPERMAPLQQDVPPERASSQVGDEYEEVDEEELTSSQLLQPQPAYNLARMYEPEVVPDESDFSSQPVLDVYSASSHHHIPVPDSTGPEKTASHDRLANISDLEDDLDLTVPEPEGGWETLSSPGRDAEPSATNNQRSKGHGLLQQPRAMDMVDYQGSSASSDLADESPGKHLLPSRTGYSDRVLYTQDILNAETQAPDLDVPLPPDTDDEFDELPLDPLANLSSSPPVEKMPRRISDPVIQQRDPRVPKSVPTQQPSQQHGLAQTDTLDNDDVVEYIITLNLRHDYTEDSIIAALKATSMRPALAELVLLEQRARKGIPQDVAGIWTEDEDGAAESGDARRLKHLVPKHGWEEIEARLSFLSDLREEN